MADIRSRSTPTPPVDKSRRHADLRRHFEKTMIIMLLFFKCSDNTAHASMATFENTDSRTKTDKVSYYIKDDAELLKPREEEKWRKELKKYHQKEDLQIIILTGQSKVSLSRKAYNLIKQKKLIAVVAFAKTNEVFDIMHPILQEQLPISKGAEKEIEKYLKKGELKKALLKLVKELLKQKLERPADIGLHGAFSFLNICIERSFPEIFDKLARRCHIGGLRSYLYNRKNRRIL
jgi:vacuolar-type H+-ATPase subunit F/Vma7